MRIEVHDGSVVVQLSFWNRLAAARCSDVALPLEHIRLPVRLRPAEASQCCKGLRVGTAVPGGLTAGTFYHWQAPPDFYYMSHPDRTIAIDLSTPPSRYGKVIVEVGADDSVEAVAAAIERAVEEREAAAAAGGERSKQGAKEGAAQQRMGPGKQQSSELTQPLI